MTYDQLLDRIISDGIAEVRQAYGDPKDHHKRDGAIEGFEACRGKMPAELVELWCEVEKECSLIRSVVPVGVPMLKDTEQIYWRTRYKALQVEFVLNVVSVGLGQPLLAHLPTYRGAMKYAEIVGVRGGGEAAS